MHTYFSLWNNVSQVMLPFLEETYGPLTEKEALFIQTAELARVDKHLEEYGYKGNGRRPSDLKALALAFIAKAVWNFPTTRHLIEYLKASSKLRMFCGWEYAKGMPSESTFSRAFDKFAKAELPSQIQQAMVKAFVKREGEEDKIIGHVSYDSTAIDAREKSAKKEKKQPKQKKKRGRPKKNEASEAASPKRLELQIKRGLEDNLKDLPYECDIGAKINAKGYLVSWRGYKLHLAIADGGIPICAILTSASMHDSGAIIPLMQMSYGRVLSLYDLGDAAYDAQIIRGFSCSLGHVPIIDHNPRKGEKIQMCPAKEDRYKERTTVERANSQLKDNLGGNSVRVRGAKKVMAHLMFGLIALTASQICRMFKEKAEAEAKQRLEQPLAA